MNNNGQKSFQLLQVQGLLNSYLLSRSQTQNYDVGEVHLGGDAISAFIDGNLSEKEAQPIVLHLTECNFCRDISAQLIRLSADTEEFAVAPTNLKQSKGVSEVLAGILERVFGSAEGAVFAHNEEKKPDKDEETEAES
ncbi:MAG: zf-HC2 domain-containing protein [Pyrinomonadaceae bacterium]